ncbi:MAG: glycosyltransferase family 4 protein [Candidatus Rokubacteria bacterium]|nr:glycosyltransferase family 4 protein [Candidatus Rokubacteria bacterium]
MPETLAFVIPWYGAGIAGGAEAECRATARALAARGLPVEILTTCARDHATRWANYYPTGRDEVDGLPVRRFKVRPRDPAHYRHYDWRLRRGGTLSPVEEQDFVRDSIHSDDLYAYLAAERSRYWYAFIPYCFGTSWEGVLAAPDRALLIPCLHDEPYAYLGATVRALRAARAVCFHVPAERRLAERLAGGDPGSFVLVGEGVDTGGTGDAARFRENYRIAEPFLLYAGRKAREKNVPLLVDYFARYRFAHRDSPLKLVLIGSGDTRIPEPLWRDVLDLGFVSAQDKLDAYAACLALCQPSLLESFSIVIMEAWLCGAPALVHAGCAVTRDHCLAGNGGLFFGEYFEFVEAVELLLADAGLRRRLGENGRAYVLTNFTWDRVTDNYLRVLDGLGAKLS